VSGPGCGLVLALASGCGVGEPAAQSLHCREAAQAPFSLRVIRASRRIPRPSRDRTRSSRVAEVRNGCWTRRYASLRFAKVRLSCFHTAEVMGSSPVSPTGRCQNHNVCAGHGLFRVSDRSDQFVCSFKPLNHDRTGGRPPSTRVPNVCSGAEVGASNVEVVGSRPSSSTGSLKRCVTPGQRLHSVSNRSGTLAVVLQPNGVYLRVVLTHLPSAGHESSPSSSDVCDDRDASASTRRHKVARYVRAVTLLSE
jgi:hypothetical protein